MYFFSLKRKATANSGAKSQPAWGSMLRLPIASKFISCCFSFVNFKSRSYTIRKLKLQIIVLNDRFWKTNSAYGRHVQVKTLWKYVLNIRYNILFILYLPLLDIYKLIIWLFPLKSTTDILDQYLLLSDWKKLSMLQWFSFSLKYCFLFYILKF